MSNVAQVQEEAVPAGRSGLAGALKVWSRTRNHVWRAIYLLGVLAFLLPFATVKGCGSGEITDYRGFEMITKEFTNAGWVFLLPICVGLAFFGLSFVRRRRYGQILLGFLKGWRAVFASIATFVVFFFPFVTFLFDDVKPRIGYFLAGTCWSLVCLHSLIGTFVYSWRVRVARASPCFGPLLGVVLLRVLHYVLAVYLLLVVLPVAYYGMRNDLLLIPACLLTLLAFVSLFLALHFAAEGIRIGQRWAIVWGVLFSCLILAGGTVGIVFAIKTNEVMTLVVVAPVTCFVAVVLGAALTTLRTFARARTPA